jgi:Ras-related protein Rab-1A
MSCEYDYVLKIILVGDSGIGKSSLMLRFVDNMYTDTYISTIGVDFKTRIVPYKSKKIKLQIWDTAGQEIFRNIVSSYYRTAHGILLTYDITQQSSFQHLQQYWMKDIIKYRTPDASIMIVGTKSDLYESREVRSETAAEYAIQCGATYMETSARSTVNVEKVFTDLVAKIMENVEGKDDVVSNGISIERTFDERTFHGTCCPLM